VKVYRFGGTWGYITDPFYCFDEMECNPTNGVVKLRIMGPLVVELEVEHLIGSVKDIGDPTWDAPSIPTFGIGP